MSASPFSFLVSLQNRLDNFERRQEQILQALVGTEDRSGLIQEVREQGHRLDRLADNLHALVDSLRAKEVIL